MQCYKADLCEDKSSIKAFSFPTLELSPDELNVAQANLLKGVKVLKYCRNGKKKEKVLRLDTARLKLTYTPSKKPVSDTTIYIKDINEIRDVETGKSVPETAIFKKADSKIMSETKELCSAFIFRSSEGYKSLNLQFQSHDEKVDVLMVITFLAHRTRRSLTTDPETQRILELWMEADQNNDKRLSREEVTVLLQKLNVQLNKSALKEMFEQADKDGSNYLSFDEFKLFYKALHKRTEVERIFDRFAMKEGNQKLMKSDLFSAFRKERQKEKIEEKEVKEVMTLFGDPNKVKGLTLSQFTSYLFSQRNTWWKQHDREKITHEMGHPLNKYFIASSHNTYLKGDQLISRSSTDMYKIVLEKGCRCVELDCWDGPNGEPDIYHGYTRTSKIKFRAAVETIGKYAFKTTPYPVILSLEVHTSVEQQRVMARDMRAVFGDNLLTRSDVEEGRLPFTPHGLMNKILIKGKMAPEHYKRRDDEVSDEETDEVSKQGKESPAGHGHAKKVALELSDIVTIRATKVTDWGERSKVNEIQSFSETACNHIIETDPARFVKMNKSMMSRVYPSGMRIASDNYDPFAAWSVGCQCVALNYQVIDAPMRLMETKFESNGGCGYLLKPKHLRDEGGFNDYRQPSCKLVVTVISGYQIPKPAKGVVVDPYVTVHINGTRVDTCEPLCTTAKKNNGFNPIWNQQFSFTIRCVNIAMLTLRVLSEKMGTDEKIAESSIPILSLRKGFRCVPLRSIHDRSELENSSLLCCFDLSSL